MRLIACSAVFRESIRSSAHLPHLLSRHAGLCVCVWFCDDVLVALCSGLPRSADHPLLRSAQNQMLLFCTAHGCILLWWSRVMLSHGLLCRSVAL